MLTVRRSSLNLNFKLSDFKEDFNIFQGTFKQTALTGRRSPAVLANLEKLFFAGRSWENESIRATPDSL
jgi:hypothetical protein